MEKVKMEKINTKKSERLTMEMEDDSYYNSDEDSFYEKDFEEQSIIIFKQRIGEIVEDRRRRVQDNFEEIREIKRITFDRRRHYDLMRLNTWMKTLPIATAIPMKMDLNNGRFKLGTFEVFWNPSKMMISVTNVEGEKYDYMYDGVYEFLLELCQPYLDGDELPGYDEEICWILEYFTAKQGYMENWIRIKKPMTLYFLGEAVTVNGISFVRFDLNENLRFVAREYADLNYPPERLIKRQDFELDPWERLYWTYTALMPWEGAVIWWPQQTIEIMRYEWRNQPLQTVKDAETRITIIAGITALIMKGNAVIIQKLSEQGRTVTYTNDEQVLRSIFRDIQGHIGFDIVSLSVR